MATNVTSVKKFRDPSIERDLEPRRANDFIIHPRSFRQPAKLFDEFWHEGELALLFGASGSGTSILALQLADAISRGHGLHGFQMPRGRRRVLYVDLTHTDQQFQMRCSSAEPGPRTVKRRVFAKGLFRDRPLPGENLCAWLCRYVAKERIRAVIIDDLSAAKDTHDGTRETLRLMRELRGLCHELNISVLVLADASEPRKADRVGEKDLGRSRVLCTVADSVFALGRNQKWVGDHYLLQTRKRTAPIFWTDKNAPTAFVERAESGGLALAFDERFTPEPDMVRVEYICLIKWMHDRGSTFRDIAEDMEISRSWAHKLYKQWTPEIQRVWKSWAAAQPPWLDPAMPQPTTPQPTTPEIVEEEWPDADEGNKDEDEGQISECESKEEYSVPDVYAIPFAAGLRRRSVYDLRSGYNKDSEQIYVERECERTGRPLVWYQFDRVGIKSRFERRLNSINITRLNPGPYL